MIMPSTSEVGHAKNVANLQKYTTVFEMEV